MKKGFETLSNKADTIRFSPRDNSFYKTVSARINDYFNKNGLSPYANTEMWLKTILMLFLYFAPCALIATGVAAASGWLFYTCWLLAGIGLIGIGTSVMHDANHGAYSPNKKVNNRMSHVLEAIGGYTVNWKIQHNMLHHAFTNIEGMDEDIDSIPLLRLSPHQPKYWFHRYQHLYAWLLYMIMTLFWMMVKDYIQVIGYHRRGLLEKQNISFAKALFRITVVKIIYYGYILVLPLLFSGMPWYQVVAGFLLMHGVAGLFLSCLFQSAHIVETSSFAAPVSSNGKYRMEDSWAIHELSNTTNFAYGNKLLTWFVGGLNLQIEHHLFANICHVHYAKLAPIIRSACAEFNLPYHEERSFGKALAAHARMLRQLGLRSGI